jgi:hypothetical protein
MKKRPIPLLIAQEEEEIVNWCKEMVLKMSHALKS